MKAVRVFMWYAAFVLALPGQIAAAEATKGSSSDIVIVGSGISGLSAALEAARHGAAVTVIDMASVFGGHAVMSSGMVCLIGTPEQEAAHVVDSPELATRDFLKYGEDANPDWAKRYARESRRAVYDWLHDLGISGWELFPQVIPGNSVRRQHVAKGRGMGLVSPIYRECLRYANLSFVWNTKVNGLMVESGRVVGVRGTQMRKGQSQEFRANSVILATGGFESNLELVRAHWPRYFPSATISTRVLLGSGINAHGSGLALAEDAGGALAKLDHQLFYSTGLVDPRDPSGRRGLHAFNRSAIWVNAQGKRFVADGQPDPKNQVPAVLNQDPQSYWSIFDSTSRPEFFVSGSDWNDTNAVQKQIFENPGLSAWVKQSDSIESLAQAAGLPADALVETVRRWNRMIGEGEDVDFHRFAPTSPERPPRIDKPPFYAVQHYPLSRKSLGGVAVDLNCRVLDKQNHPISGLFAIGELAGVGGINGKGALEGTMLGPGIFMGRIAAKESVRLIQHKLKPPQRAAGPPKRPIAQTAPETLTAWREVLRQLITSPRPGYFHFEKVHGAVLARNYACAKCHRETSPLVLTEDQLDRRELIQSCALCHGGVKE